MIGACRWRGETMIRRPNNPRKRLCIERQNDAGNTGSLKKTTNIKIEKKMKKHKKVLGALFLVAILTTVLFACTKWEEQKDSKKLLKQK
jgi:hypothetical protein